MISSSSNQIFSCFSDPRIALMLEALSGQDEELARVTQKTTEAIAKTDMFLQQTFQDFSASGERLEELLAEAQAHNMELEKKQQKEMLDLEDESIELKKTLDAQEEEIQALAVKQKIFTGSIKAIQEDCALVRNGIRAFTRHMYQDPDTAANLIFNKYTSWCQPRCSCENPGSSEYAISIGQRVRLTAHVAEFEKIRKFDPEIL